MKRPFIAVLPWMAAIILAVTSCGGKENTQNGGDPQPAAQGTTRTEGVLYMISRLDGNTLFSSDADATAVDNYVKNTLKGSAGKEFTILDRVDGSGLVKANTIAVNNYRWIFHNIGRQVSKTDFQTSAVFMNSPQRDVHSLQAASTWFTFFNPTLKASSSRWTPTARLKSPTTSNTPSSSTPAASPFPKRPRPSEEPPAPSPRS